jgi:serine/threonine-protein kinase
LACGPFISAAVSLGLEQRLSYDRKDMSESGADGTGGATVAAAAPPASRDPLIGQVLDGRYRVESVLGEGGMGLVYKAVHVALRKPLAIKVLRPEVSKNEQIVARFRQEAQSASAIGNQHIIDISDFGELQDGSTYFVMEFLTGRSLTAALEAGRFTTPRTVHVCKQLCRALGAAHEIGVVHRDMKPDNVQLIERGSDKDFVKVLDFGIAKVGGGTSKLTQAGQVFGTPHYMSPEQCAGTAVDHRTDIYAVGVMLYEMATGAVPFDADNLMGILTKHLYENPIPPHQLPPPVDVSPAMEAVIMKCLSKKPELRYQNMAELLEDLEAIEAGMTPKAVVDRVERNTHATHTPSDLEPGRVTVGLGQPGVPGKKPVLPIVIGIVALVGAGIAFMAMSGGDSNKPTTDAHVVQPAAPVQPTTPAPPTTPTPPPTAAKPPAQDPVAPAPSLVTIDSDPSGAELYRDNVLLGNTPFKRPRPTGNEQLQFELRRPGYESKAFLITAFTGDQLNISLTRKKSSSPRPPPAAAPVKPDKPKPRPPAQSEVLDPWD